MAAKGQPKTGGRQKGAANVLTAQLKDMVLQAADKAHPDGIVAYLTKVAQDSPATFVPLLGKVMPLQIAGHDGGALETVVKIKLEAG